MITPSEISDRRVVCRTKNKMAFHKASFLRVYEQVGTGQGCWEMVAG
jgi:hypothetical protein